MSQEREYNGRGGGIAMKRALIVFVLLMTTQALCGQAPQAPVPSKVQKLADDLYVILSEGSNTTVYLTDEGVILVDTKFDRNHDDIIAKVKELTNKPIKYIINTHAHVDHTGGNAKMLPGPEIIGSARLRDAMMKGKLAGAPTVTFADEMSIFLGGKEVVVRHFGPCHTDGDTWIYFPARKALASGDCFNTGNGQGVNLTGSPTFAFYIDYNTGGSLNGRAKVADAALKLDWNTVIPGHGPVTDRAGFMKWRTDTDAIRNRVTSMVREGKTKDDVTKMLVNEFGWDPMGRATTNSIDGMMAEMRKQAQ
jgi:glyoxylase-like metal-dependent hydrolase (beta-lactamase superfamily II)